MRGEYTANMYACDLLQYELAVYSQHSNGTVYGTVAFQIFLSALQLLWHAEFMFHKLKKLPVHKRA